MNQPFFNLVVPTKNRVNTLTWTLRNLLQQDYPHYQIVVSDNCSEDNTAEVVAELQKQNNKIQYYCTPQRLSMASNYEFALSKLEKGYVMFVGDDDGLCPQSLTMLAKIVAEQQPEAFMGKRCIYNWLNHPDPLQAGLLIESRSSDYYYWQDTDFILQEAADWMYIFNLARHNGLALPSMYHGGCAHLDLVRRIQRRDGRFFNCQFPDYYSCIIIAAEVKRYLFIETPYFISGASGNSTGISAFLNEKDKKSEFQQFQKDNDIPLSQPLVFCHSFALFTAEAILKAKQYNPRVAMFDWANLLTKMYDDALAKPQKAQYDDVVDKLQQIAASVGLEQQAAQMIQKRAYQIPTLTRLPEGLGSQKQNYVHHTEKHGVENIQQVGEYLLPFNKNRTPSFLNDPQRFFKKKKSNRFWKLLWAKVKRLFR